MDQVNLTPWNATRDTGSSPGPGRLRVKDKLRDQHRLRFPAWMLGLAATVQPTLEMGDIRPITDSDILTLSPTSRDTALLHYRSEYRTITTLSQSKARDSLPTVHCDFQTSIKWEAGTMSVILLPELD